MVTLQPSLCKTPNTLHVEDRETRMIQTRAIGFTITFQDTSRSSLDSKGFLYLFSKKNRPMQKVRILQNLKHTKVGHFFGWA